MKKLILVSLMLLSLETLYGQGFQVGLRTGCGLSTYPNINTRSADAIYRKKESPTKDYQVFSRTETKNWAFEHSLDLSVIKITETGYGYPYCVFAYTAPGYYYTDVTTINRFLLTSSVQHSLYKSSRFNTYAGIMTSLELAISKTESERIINEEVKYTEVEVFKYKTFGFIAGLNVYASYRMNKSIAINALAYSNISISEALSSFNNNPIIGYSGARIGISYSFN